AKSDVQQRLYLWLNLGNVFQQRQGVFDRGIEQFGNRLSLVSDRERLAIVSGAATDVAQNVNVREKIHLDPLHALALARFAAPAFHVERKAAGFVTSLTRLRQHCIQFAQRREETCVGCRIGTRRAADWRLVDLDYLVDML